MTAARAAAHATRVLIVDDSPFMRRAIERLLLRTGGVQIAGTAADGAEAVQKVLALRPDVVTMDVNMPRMDGVNAVEAIMSVRPTPIVMVSSLATEHSDTAIRALEAGAVECVAKPSGSAAELATIGEHLAYAVQRASEARVHRRQGAPSLSLARKTLAGSRQTSESEAARRIVVIGSSTGGPPALTAIIPELPADFAAGVLVIQHMPAGFTGALARRLDSLSALSVREAVAGEVISTGSVLIAPGDYHVTIGDDRRVRLSQEPSRHGVRPAVDASLESVAKVYGRHATVVILTGMGRDGGMGAALVDAAGGTVLVQDKDSSVVYGMPRVARELVPAAREVSLAGMAAAIIRVVGGR